MSLLSVTRPRLLHWRQHCKNGLVPDATFHADATAAMNHGLAYCGKALYRRTCKLGEAGGTSGVAWRWHCKTGYGTKRVAVLVTLGLDDRALAVDPYITVSMTKSGGATTTLTFHGGASHTPSVDAPEEWLPQIQYLDVDPASTYEGQVEFFDNVRVISLQVYEDANPTVDQAVDYFSEWTPAAASPIYDGRIARLLAGVGALHRKNGALRADWCHVQGTSRTRTSATWVNLIDNASASPPTAATPGWTFNTQYRNTAGATTVPVRFAVYGSVAAGGTASVRLRNTSGTDVITVTINSSTPQWWSATGGLALSSALKLDPGYLSDGSHLLTVQAVSLYEDTP